MNLHQEGEGFGAALKAVMVLLSLATLARSQDFDLLFRGGRIVDGTGNPSYLGDLGILHGKIVSMGHLNGKTATRVVEAAGLDLVRGPTLGPALGRSRGRASRSAPGSEQGARRRLA